MKDESNKFIVAAESAWLDFHSRLDADSKRLADETHKMAFIAGYIARVLEQQRGKL